MKLRSDSFLFLRNTPPNLSRYLPRFLYNDEIFKNTQDALNIEHNNYRLKLIETARQFFVQTADSEGLKDWEKLLKITPTDNLELRRKVVAMKLLRNFAMTLPNTKRLINEFRRTESGAADIEELGDNKIKISIDNGDFYWELLYESLMEWLPAHLLIEEILIDRDFNHNVFFALPLATSNFSNFELDLISPPFLRIKPKIFTADISADTVNLDDLNETVAQVLSSGFFSLISEKVEIACGDILEDEETIEDFERYILEKWRKFKTNPVVKWYLHDEDGEIDNPDDEEFFPVDTDFLRIYWTFDCPNDADGAGGKNYHYRYQTILNPKENIQPAEINYLSSVGKNLLLHSKLNIPTTGIIRALYIKKQEIKVL